MRFWISLQISFPNTLGRVTRSCSDMSYGDILDLRRVSVELQILLSFKIPGRDQAESK
jgi:hypothetical protein